MPRENIPAEVQLAWNVAFRQIIMSHVGVNNLTDYVDKITPFVKETEKIFRSYTEKWVRNIKIKNADELADKINDLDYKINDLE